MLIEKIRSVSVFFFIIIIYLPVHRGLLMNKTVHAIIISYCYYIISYCILLLYRIIDILHYKNTIMDNGELYYYNCCCSYYII